MGHKLLKVIAIVSPLLYSAQAFATWNYQDYGDAPGSENEAISDNQGFINKAVYNGSYNHGEAAHKTPQWQRLGDKWDTDSSTANNDFNTDDGVKWSIKQADGTWSEFSKNQEFTQGDEVKFQFDFTRSQDGDAHYYDQLRAWVDWNEDGTWDDSEEIISKTWYKWQDSNDQEDTSTGDTDTAKNDLLSNMDNSSQTYADLISKGVTLPTNYNAGDVFNSDDLKRTYYTEVLTIPTVDTVDHIWLRARVACSESIINNGNGVLNPTDYYHQGEVEDYLLTIKEKEPPTDVPEPATLVILLSGLGLMAYRQRKQKDA